MKKLLHFIKKNYFLLIFAFVILLVGFFSFYKLFFTKPTYIYVKVKLGQGMWWASSTIEPPQWLVNSIKKTSNPIDVLKIQYYPLFITGVNNQFIDQYNTYLTLKLKVTKNRDSNDYFYNRSVVAIGAPIDLELSNVQVSGTIISFSKELIEDQYIEKIVYLNKENPSSWEYDGIKVGDCYFDGENKVFEVIGKEISSDNSLIVKAKIKIKEINNHFVFGEDSVITVGKNINIFTNNFTFNNYTVSRMD
jgi:hypothetical protein